MTSFLQELKYGDGIQLARSRELDECFAQANDQMEITDSLIREMRQMGQPCDAYQKRYCGDFPGGPVAKPPPAANAGGPGSIPGQGTRSHMLQLKIPHAVTKTS